MITPEDIQTKEFSKSVRGYSQEEVDQFLDDLTLDYEAVLKENEQLKQDLTELQDKYKDQEESIYYTLQSAKQLMTDISTSAERRAEILLKNAQLDADNLTRQTKSSLAYLQEQEAVMKNRVFKLKTKIKNILEAELEDINTIELDIFQEQIPDTFEKVMTYSAEFDGFFPAEESEEDIPEDNKKTILVAGSAKPQPEEALQPEDAPQPEEALQPEDAPQPEEAEPVIEAAADTLEEIADTAEELVSEAAETIAEPVAEALEDAADDAAKTEEFLNEFIFSISDDADAEEE